MRHQPRILFVCARNLWRSPTAEAMYRDDSRVEARSAGVSEAARRRLGAADLDWADLVLVMEREHKRRIVETFGHHDLPSIESLEIPDDYQYGDEELQALIRAGSEPLIERLLDEGEPS